MPSPCYPGPEQVPRAAAFRSVSELFGLVPAGPDGKAEGEGPAREPFAAAAHVGLYPPQRLPSLVYDTDDVDVPAKARPAAHPHDPFHSLPIAFAYCR